MTKKNVPDNGHQELLKGYQPVKEQPNWKDMIDIERPEPGAGYVPETAERKNPGKPPKKP